MPRGAFITFEGIDGVGKTTAAKAFVELMNQTYGPTIFVKVPGEIINGELVGSSIGPSVRQILFSGDYPDLSYEVKSILMLADHVNLTDLVRKTIETGVHVVSDRYMDSQFVYWDKPDTHVIQRFYRELYTLKPDVTFLLLGDPATCIERAASRGGDDSKKQTQKQWNNAEELGKIQGAYIRELDGQERTIMFGTSCLKLHEVAQIAQSRFEVWLEEKRTVNMRELLGLLKSIGKSPSL